MEFVWRSGSHPQPGEDPDPASRCLFPQEFRVGDLQGEDEFELPVLPLVDARGSVDILSGVGRPGRYELDAPVQHAFAGFDVQVHGRFDQLVRIEAAGLGQNEFVKDPGAGKAHERGRIGILAVVGGLIPLHELGGVLFLLLTQALDGDNGRNAPGRNPFGVLAHGLVEIRVALAGRGAEDIALEAKVLGLAGETEWRR